MKGENMEQSVRYFGLGSIMEKKLHSVNVHYASDLQRMGSKEAVSLLKEKYPNTRVDTLYRIEAALRGVDMKQLDDACKADLREYFRQL